MTEKVTWYRGWRKKPPKKFKNHPRGILDHPRGTSMKTNKDSSEKVEVKGVLFVEHTPDSTLANRLREEENRLSQTTGYRIKIVEKAGDRLDRTLIKSDVKEGKDCERSDCRVCISKPITMKSGQSCSRRSLTYRGTCFICKDSDSLPTAEYIGETGADLYTRSRTHQRLWERADIRSWMLRHYVLTHQDIERSQVEFTFEAIKFHRTAFKRQVQESCLIKWSKQDPEKNNLNNKCEYNRSIIPELGAATNPTTTEMEEERKTIEKVKEWKVRNGFGELKTERRTVNKEEPAMRKRQPDHPEREPRRKKIRIDKDK